MGELKIVQFTCEYRTNPLGLDLAAPRFSWQIGSGVRNVMQASYRLQVAGDEGFVSRIVWDTGEVSSDRSIHVAYGGPAVTARTRYYCRVRVRDTQGNASAWSDTICWETGLLHADNWLAEWIGADIASGAAAAEPALLLRKAFAANGQVAAARLYATSLGIYELELNGRRVGDALFTPGWTSYRNRLQYQTYDVTDLLREGDNALGVALANGWYKGVLGWNGRSNYYGEQRAALVQLHLVYADGREQTLVTDRTWKVSTGPILMAELYHGETYDARLEQPGWSSPGFDDRNWSDVTALDRTKGNVIAQENGAVRVMETIRPIRLFTTPAGETVLDLGQNMVGWMQLRVRGQAGQRITLQHAEVLDRDGNFYTGNLRAARQTVTYICKGGGETEIYEPRFTFQGFRYVKVEGITGELSPDDFLGKVIHTEMEPTGRFTCSDPLVNQLQHNIVWGQKGNFLDVPTDCPQRDERLGWTGDAQVFVRTAAFNMNVANFFAKWLRDLRADQRPDGGVPYIVPDVHDEGAHSAAAWGDAAVICPWTLYLYYGDRRVLEEQYDSMKAWVEYIRRQGDNEYLWNTGEQLGDWLALDTKDDSCIGATPTDLIATAYYAYSTQLLAQTAEALGRHEDALAYGELRRHIGQHFRNEFVTPGGRLAADTQTAHVLALMFGLVEGEAGSRVARTLVEQLTKNGFALTTGFVGTPYLCHVLSGHGYHDIAAKVALRREYPSWLYMVGKGATTIWEHWDGIKEDGSFWSDEMNSFNHYAYGAIGDWFYSVVAGIDADARKPGYKHAHIRPKPVAGLSYAHASLKSMYGLVESRWELDAQRNEMKVQITVPVNTTASVELPCARAELVRERSGRLGGGNDGIGGSGGNGGTGGIGGIGNVPGVLSCEQGAAATLLELGSGAYEFVYEWNPWGGGEQR